jgi:hypothetical protein
MTPLPYPEASAIIAHIFRLNNDVSVFEALLLCTMNSSSPSNQCYNGPTQ